MMDLTPQPPLHKYGEGEQRAFFLGNNTVFLPPLYVVERGDVGVRC